MEGMAMAQAAHGLERPASADIYDVAIIGGGPAGLSAAMYAARANFKDPGVRQKPNHQRPGADPQDGKLSRHSSGDFWGRIAVELPAAGRNLLEQKSFPLRCSALVLRMTSKQVLTMEQPYRSKNRDCRHRFHGAPGYPEG